MPNDKLHCSLLLQLPRKQDENGFWSDEDTLRAYTTWDFYTCIHILVGNLIMAKTLWRVMGDVSALPQTWHVHIIVLINVVVNSLMLSLMQRRRDVYKQHRRILARLNRLLRFVMFVGGILKSSSAQQALWAKAMNAEQPQASAPPQLRDAALNLLRPLFLSPSIPLAHGMWVFETKYWLPVQLLTAVLAIFGLNKHQHCRLAAEASSALLLQPICRGFSTLHQYMASAILGPALLPAGGPLNSSQDLPACTSMTSSARTLVWYTQLLYGLLVPAACFCTLEWRLKAKYVQKRLGKQLVYGPWGWPRSCSAPATFCSVLQSGLSWLLFIFGGLAAVWCVSVWLVPRLPLMACETCQDKGTCLEVAPCQGVLCDDPASTVTSIIYLQAALTLIILVHLAGTHFQ